MGTYTLDTAWALAHERLARLAAAFDPGTFRVLDEIGVGPGWYCLEAGAGGGSVARWLAARVGLGGSVVATDIDPRHVSPLGSEFPNLEVRQHNIVSDPLPSGAFELIHARLLLEHLPERDNVLRRLADAVAPGGWLVIEAIDFASEAPDPGLDAADAALFERWHAAQVRHLAEHGFDHTFARGLARRLRTLGLGEVRTDGRASTWWGGSAGADVWRLSVAQLRGAMRANGLLGPADADALEALFCEPGFAATSPLVVAAWGRKPRAPRSEDEARARFRQSMWTGG